MPERRLGAALHCPAVAPRRAGESLVMTYAPPSGWVEHWELDSGLQARFHAREDCARVRDRRELRRVDQPYSAARCAGCADEYGRNRDE